MSFTVTTDKDKTVHTVKNHPIAALAIKDDGKMYVSIATNYCYASDYKYEETNYNSEYMNYKMGNQTISRGGDNDKGIYVECKFCRYTGYVKSFFNR